MSSKTTLAKTPLVSCNTEISTNSVNFKGRNFHLVVWPGSEKYYRGFIEYIESLKCFQYILVCLHDKEDNDNLTEHKHIFIQLNECRTLNKKKLGTIHCEQCFASAQKNIEYVKGLDKKHKELGVNCEVIYEKGNPLLKGGFHSIKEVKEASDEEVGQMDVKLINCINKIRPPTKTKFNEWHKKIKVYYIYGTVSGIGKTLSIYRIVGLNKRDNEGFTEVKHSGNFWLNVSGDAVEGIGIYDDFRDSSMPAQEFVNFIDYHIHNMDYKGGSAKNKFDLIIITSIQSPYEIYRNMKQETRIQWLRRIKKINLDKININQFEEAQDDI